MTRKITLLAALLGVLTTLAVTSTAEAGPRIRIDIRTGSVGFGEPIDYRAYAPPVAVPVAVSAYSPAPAVVYEPPVHHRRHYHVLYRHCCHEPWREYSCYDCRDLAEAAEDRLERHGFQARIVRD